MKTKRKLGVSFSQPFEIQKQMIAKAMLEYDSQQVLKMVGALRYYWKVHYGREGYLRACKLYEFAQNLTYAEAEEWAKKKVECLWAFSGS